MFSSLHPGSYGRPAAFANAYRQVGAATSVESASPHRLIALLFDGYMDALATARGAMRNGEIEAKSKAISRAARIVDEGLKAGLNLKDGGRLAADLHSLYEYLTLRLTLANVRNDDRILEECGRLVEPLRQAWREIGPRVDGAAVLN